MVRLLMLFVACLLMACGGPGEEASSLPVEDQARAGKADDGNYEQEASDELDFVEAEEEEYSHPLIWDGEDMCETAGFYEDEDCQDFCPKVDPVCPPPEPEPEDVGIPCFLETPVCEDEQSIIDTDQNGCGDTCAEPEVDCAVNADCAEGSYCARPMGECDASVGTCTALPECIINPDTWKPDLVCGCDTVTYGSPCDAASAGVNLLEEGFCAYLR